MATTASLEEIFLSALERESEADRSQFLDQACGDRPGLREEVERLLAAHQGAAGFLESPPTMVVAATDQITAFAESAVDLSFLSPTTRTDSLGRLGNYEILEVVGSGGFGVVLRAFDEKLHRVVAIKTLNPLLAASVTARKRFVREAQAAAAINHDNIVHIYAVEDAGPTPYLAMEYVAGLSLDEKLRRQGPLPLKEVLRIGLQIAEGLTAAHQHGVVHRDVKPGNILLENGIQRVKITDFGLARAVDDATLTKSGEITGTPAYMSPEQARGEGIDHRSDLFSLGSVLYAMCVGEPPFKGASSLSVLKRVCEDAPRPPRELNPDVPEWLCQIIARLHAKDPAERFQSAAEVASVLGRYLAHIQQPGLVRTEELAASSPAASAKKHSGVRPWTSVRWAIAATILCCLATALGVSETTGTTQLAVTVIRIFTPEGTLVVEANDPNVKVTIEGDGGLSITTAGGQQVRLPAGTTYKLRAVKDGKPIPLDHELVTITQGQKQVVRVRLAAPAATAATSVGATANRGAFVIVGGKDVSGRDFETLAAAVAAANGDDTIEVRGNGPFRTDLIKVNIPLTIRAGQGFQPVMRLSSALETRARLVLEGLEFERDADSTSRTRAVYPASAPLYVANCRFTGCPLHLQALPYCQLRNCLMSSVQGNLVSISNCPVMRSAVLDNNIARTRSFPAMYFDVSRYAVSSAGLQFTRNLIVGPNPILLVYPHKESPAGEIPLRVHASRNVLAAGQVVIQFQFPPPVTAPTAGFEGQDAENLLRKIVIWTEEKNVYPERTTFLGFRWAINDTSPHLPTQSLPGWYEFWGLNDAGSLQGGIYFARPEAVIQSAFPDASDRLDPADFQLTPDSAGYRAGSDGQDLGPDLEIIGPGAAYERWKQSPEYQQWLKDTGQVN